MLDNLGLARKCAATLCSARRDFEEVLSMAHLGLVRAALISKQDDRFEAFAWHVMRRTVQEGWQERARWSVEVPPASLVA